MKCPNCGGELKQLPKNPNMYRCQSCKKYFEKDKVPESQNETEGGQVSMPVSPENPQKKKGKGKVIGIVVAVIVVLAVIAGIGGGEGNENPGQTQVASETSEPKNAPETEAVEYLEISPDELLTTYEENEVKGDEIYEGKMMRLTGTVDTIGKDIAEEVYITFETSDPYSFTSVQCYFDDEAEIEKVMELKSGDTITLTGVCDGKFANVFIKDCHIE